jgi:hypothetical protein
MVSVQDEAPRNKEHRPLLPEVESQVARTGKDQRIP